MFGIFSEPTCCGLANAPYTASECRPASTLGARPSATAVSADVRRERVTDDLTVIVPTYNESESIADTVKSLLEQTLPPARIIVVDDCSTDGTGRVARSLGVDVLLRSTNTGSKAGAQTFALRYISTTYTLAIDADTTLGQDALERLAGAMDNPGVGAACGLVLPRRVRTLWERGRYVQYLYSFTFHKPVQDYYGKPFISSGCFSMYRTDVLPRGRRLV